MLAFIKDGSDNYTVICNGNSHYLSSCHPAYDDLVELINAQDAEGFERAIDVGHAIEDWADGEVKLVNGVLMYNAEEVHDVIASRVIEIMQDGNKADALIAFLKELYQNSSFRAINELYTFMEHKFLPITPDGCFLAYKVVKLHEGDDITGINGETITRGDLVDKWTGKAHRNNLNDEVSMSRHLVTDDCSQPCGPGLHGGSRDYAEGYKSSDKEVIVMIKVNPKDVVSIPTDSGCKKLRCCAYTVVSTDEYDKSIVDQAVVDPKAELQAALKVVLEYAAAEDSDDEDEESSED